MKNRQPRRGDRKLTDVAGVSLQTGLNNRQSALAVHPQRVGLSYAIKGCPPFGLGLRVAGAS